MMLDEPIAQLGATTISPGHAILITGGTLVFLIVVAGVVLLRAARARSMAAEEADRRARSECPYVGNPESLGGDAGTDGRNGRCLRLAAIGFEQSHRRTP